MALIFAHAQFEMLNFVKDGPTSLKKKLLLQFFLLAMSGLRQKSRLQETVIFRQLKKAEMAVGYQVKL